MSDHFSINRATPPDAAALAAFFLPLGVKEADYFARCLEEQAAGRREVLVARRGGAVAGYAMLNWRPGYPPFRRLGLPEIQDLVVAPAFRRQGLGAALIAAAEGLARARGVAEIGIAVGLTPDYGAAQRLYVRLGYVPDGAGVTYDRQTVRMGEMRAVDDNLCLMLMKALSVPSPVLTGEG